MDGRGRAARAVAVAAVTAWTLLGAAWPAASSAGTSRGLVRASGVPAAASAPSAAAPPAQDESEKSANWSGYEVLAGPYSVITGSFTVPGMSVGTPVGEQASEWVGLDGASRGDTSLVQAGVDEYPNPINPLDTVAQAWWEVLPARATNIPKLDVGEGDTVSVTIWQLSRAEWDIDLTDETTDESFTTPPVRYDGPASTAEWVVEAATLCRQKCQPAFLAPYTPDIVFTKLGITGPETSLDRITLVQDRVAVSTPSPLGADGFRVAYTGPTAFY